MTIGSIVRTPASRYGTVASIEVTDTACNVTVVFGTWLKSPEIWPHYLLRVAA